MTYSTDDLGKTLLALGIRFIAGEVISEPSAILSPTALLKGLVRSRDARYRMAVIPLLLSRPDFAARVKRTIIELEEPARSYLKLFYTAAMLLQQEHSERLETMLGARPALPDLFSRELGLAGDGDPITCLKELADRQRVLTRLSINWLGTYEHAAERFIKRLEHEAEWARLPQEK